MRFLEYQLSDLAFTLCTFYPCWISVRRAGESEISASKSYIDGRNFKARGDNFSRNTWSEPWHLYVSLRHLVYYRLISNQFVCSLLSRHYTKIRISRVGGGCHRWRDVTHPAIQFFNTKNKLALSSHYLISNHKIKWMHVLVSRNYVFLSPRMWQIAQTSSRETPQTRIC